MDNEEIRNRKREIPPTEIKRRIARIEKHKCKCCGKEFVDGYMKNICPKCHSKIKRKSCKFINNGYLKEKWMGKIGIVEVLFPEKEEWDEDFFEARSREKCDQCNQYHFKKETYFHTFKRYTRVIGLPIHEIEELLNEYKLEFKKKRIVTKRFLDERGLTIKEVK